MAAFCQAWPDPSATSDPPLGPSDPPRLWSTDDGWYLKSKVNTNVFTGSVTPVCPPGGAKESQLTNTDALQQTSARLQVQTGGLMHIFLYKSTVMIQDVSLAAAAVWLKTSMTLSSCRVFTDLQPSVNFYLFLCVWFLLRVSEEAEGRDGGREVSSGNREEKNSLKPKL